MESLQPVYQQIVGGGVYDSYSPGSNSEIERLQAANEFSDLLVVLRFQHLIRRSAAYMRQVKMPVLATSHDFDFIYEVDPSQL